MSEIQQTQDVSYSTNPASDYGKERVQKFAEQMQTKEAIYRFFAKQRAAAKEKHIQLAYKYRDTKSNYEKGLVDIAQKDFSSLGIEEDVAFGSWCNAVDSYSKAQWSA